MFFINLNGNKNRKKIGVILVIISLLFALGFIAVHLTSKYMKFLTVVPRSRLLSVTGGISVAYIFVHILPELKEHQDILHEGETFKNFFLSEHHVYLFAMIGLVIFYGLERMVMVSKKRNERKRDKHHAGAGAFWIHILAFCVYNALIGYLLVRGESKEFTEMGLYFFALALHFISNDHSLRETHKQSYDQYGRWLLSFSIFLGWGFGMIEEVSEAAIAILFSFLAGGVVLNVLKEELPEERDSNFWAFSAGVILYTSLLLLI
ncbi:hypothetical protein DS031_09260 [Bacillus taeanensis]|uniref:Uncharacterized protein n=1 Tax=Bacillus taeanensis TaxID=273032 RepID=A0A366XVP3_9BACI|nr:hypothetical protein DS031_09260 [Bacillus taeanensis]